MDELSIEEPTTWRRTYLNPTLVIHKIITMYYFEFAKDYVFTGERHHFWEIAYVDGGEIEVTTDENHRLLKQGDVIFHKPDEFHSFHATKGKATNLFVLTFDCQSALMSRFFGRVEHLDDDERNLLTQILKEGKNAFLFPFQFPLKRRKAALVGSEQLIQCYLEAFLLRLLRKLSVPKAAALLSTAAKENSDEDIKRNVIEYLRQRMDAVVTLSEISRHLHVSKTKLKDVFKKQTGYSIKEHFAKMKMEKAKVLIREETDNMTEISDKLGFASVHSFSKSFKLATRMSPTEYARSMKAREQDE